jgi:hypothetical protein
MLIVVSLNGCPRIHLYPKGPQQASARFHLALGLFGSDGMGVSFILSRTPPELRAAPTLRIIVARHPNSSELAC